MAIRPHPTKGTGWWYIDFYPEGRKGKRKMLPFQGTEAAAKRWELDLRRMTKGVKKINTFPHLNEVIPEFMDSYRLDHQPQGVERTLRSIKKLLQHFGKYQFTSINSTMIEQYKAARLKEVKPSTIQKELAALSSLCRWAAEKGYCQPIKIKRFPAKMTRAPLPTTLTKEEVGLFFAQLKQDKKGYFACLYYGGLRDSESKGLTAEAVRLDLGVMLVTGKGNKQRVVPVIDKLRPILEERISEVESGKLWDVPNDLRETIFWACKRAGIKKHITPHSFRHSFGTQATVDGVNLRTLQEVMGHSSSTVTEIYTRLASQALVKEMGKFSPVENK